MTTSGCESSAGEPTLPGDKTLDAWEASIGLPAGCPGPVETEATRLLCLTPDELRLMDAVACGEAAFTLELFALHIQRATNREQARFDRAEACLNWLLPSLLADRREFMWEERRMRAIASSPQAQHFERLMKDAQFKLDRLSFVAVRMSSLVQTLLALQKTKVAQHAP